MQNNKIKNIFLLTIISFFVSGCASSKAPTNWLTEPNDTQTDVYGGWIEIKYFVDSEKSSEIYGELIAIDQDSIFIVNDAFHAFELSKIKSARLMSYNSNFGMMGNLTALGIVSTFSNGLFFIFTMPMWLIGGPIAATTRSFQPIIDYPGKEFNQFIPFARYPQGLPEGIDRYKIKMKPVKPIKKYINSF